MKKQLQLVRREQPIHGTRPTHYRPLSHVVYRGERLSHEQIRDAYLGRGIGEYQPIEVEDPYVRGKFLKNFVVDPVSLVVMHKKVGKVPLFNEIGPLAVLWDGVRVDTQGSIGGLSEIRPRTQLMQRVRIGERSLIGSNGVASDGVEIGSAVYVGSGLRAKEQSKLGTGSVVDKGFKLGAYAIIGTQFRAKEDVLVGDGAEVGDSAYFAQGVRLKNGERIDEGWYAGIMIGDEVKLAPFTPVDAPSIVGAGNVIGDMAAIRPTAFVPKGAFIPAVMSLE